MVAITEKPAQISDSAEKIDAILAASGIAVPARDAAAIHNLALYFLAQAEIVSRSLLGKAERTSETDVGLSSRSDD